MSEKEHIIEGFFGCYLLYCLNPKFKGHTYIGFTKDPNRRINQHNTGTKAGGAKRTAGRGPWEMVLLIHGFPNDISALRFEWAWQNPKKSRRLRHLEGKRRKETRFEYRVRIAVQMLRTGPWKRLALTFRWLKQEYKIDWEPGEEPPSHMPIQYGPVKVKKLATSGGAAGDAECGEPCIAGVAPQMCGICHESIEINSTETSNDVRCLNPLCAAPSHMVCLAKAFLDQEFGSEASDGHLLPVSGHCPACGAELLWADLIRFKQGAYQDLVGEGDDEDEDFHWTQQLAAL